MVSPTWTKERVTIYFTASWNTGKRNTQTNLNNQEYETETIEGLNKPHDVNVNIKDKTENHVGLRS